MLSSNETEESELKGLSQALKCHVALEELPPLLHQLMLHHDLVDGGQKVLLLAKAKLSGKEADEGLGKAVFAVPHLSNKFSLEAEDENPLDLTGSPLQCSFNLEEESSYFKPIFTNGTNETFRRDPLRQQYRPLTPTEARSALSALTMLKLHLKWSKVLVLCTEDNEEHLLYLGLFANERDVCNNKTVRETLSVHYSGPFRRSNNKVLGIRSLVETHLNKTRTCNKEMLQSEASCTFVFEQEEEDNGTMSTDDGDKENLARKGNSLKLNLSWPKPTSTLELPPSEAKTSLEAKVVLDSMFSVTRDFYGDMKTLQNLSKGLKDEGVCWQKRDSDEDEFETQIEKLMQKVRDESVRTRFLRKTLSVGKPRVSNLSMGNSSTVIDDDDTKLDYNLMEKRLDLDFLDQLYLVLIRAQSYSEVKEGLTRVFTVISEEQLRPFIFPDSGTMVAEMIGKIHKGLNNDLSLFEGALPLQMLLQLGVEKARRDIAFSLTSSFFLSKDQLRHLMNRSSSASADETINHLLFLLAIIELTSLVRTYSSPPNELLGHLVMTTFEKYWTNKEACEATNEESNVFEFRVDLGTRWPKEQLCKSLPSSWQLRLSSLESGLHTMSVTHISDTAPVLTAFNNTAAINKEENGNNDGIIETTTEGPLLYCTHLIAVSRTL